MVRSLARLVEGVLSTSPQANFRVNAYRLHSKIDIQPSVENLAEFFNLILAEMETLMLSPEFNETDKMGKAPPAVKILHQEKGEKGGKGDKGSRNLCRSCRFDHPVLPDSRDRCWICSSTSHQKTACPYNKQGPPQKPMSTSGGSDGREGRGGKPSKGGKGAKGGDQFQQDDGKGKGNGNGSSEDKRAASMSTAKKEDEDAKEQESRGSEQAATGSTGETTATAGETALLTEVTSFLRSLRSSGQQRSPAVKVACVKKLDPTENTSYLLDGGATHPLRQCKNRAEWNAATPTVVNLALGEAKLLQKENGTLLTEGPVQPIIPVQDLTMIGVKVIWADGVCRMMLQGSKLGVYMDQGCPCVGAVEGRRLMEQVEELHTRRAALRNVRYRPRDEDTSEDERSLRFFFNLFPDVPQYIAEKVIGYADYDTSRLPWNRKTRRRIEEASCLVLQGGDWMDGSKRPVLYVHGRGRAVRKRSC